MFTLFNYLLGSSFHYDVLSGARVVVRTVSDSAERGKRARPQTELGKGLEYKGCRWFPLV